MGFGGGGGSGHRGRTYASGTVRGKRCTGCSAADNARKHRRASRRLDTEFEVVVARGAVRGRFVAVERRLHGCCRSTRLPLTDLRLPSAPCSPAASHVEFVVLPEPVAEGPGPAKECRTGQDRLLRRALTRAAPASKAVPSSVPAARASLSAVTASSPWATSRAEHRIRSMPAGAASTARSAVLP